MHFFRTLCTSLLIASAGLTAGVNPATAAASTSGGGPFFQEQQTADEQQKPAPALAGQQPEGQTTLTGDSLSADPNKPGLSYPGVDTLSLQSIFYDPLLAGNRPDFSTFSPDLSHVYFMANDSSMSEEESFRVPLDGGDVTPLPDDARRRFQVSPKGDRLVYSKNGNIWIANTDFSNPKRLVDTKTRAYNPTWGPDGRHVAFIQEGNVWILNTETSGLTQVTDAGDEAPSYSIAGWADPDQIVLMQWDTSDYEEYYFPEYVGHYVQTGATRRGVATQHVSVAHLDSIRVDSLYSQKGYTDLSVSASGRYIALDLLDAPMKQRHIKVIDLQQQDTVTVFEDQTQGWMYGTEMAFAPEGDQLMFQSEQDGWNHIYTVNPDGSDLRQHTRGEFDIPWAEWAGAEEIVFASNKVDPGERQVYLLETGDRKVRRLTDRTGYRQSFALSRDGRHLVYEYTHFNRPFELYALDLEDPDREVRLSQTIPQRFRQIQWQQEDYIRFTGRDGQTRLSMSVLEPHNKQPDQQYPVVVFVHGAGSLQNVYKGWSNSYYREYMFHQYLNARGYYVVEVDYRHSTGYGREFREDVTNWMGKYETQDIVDGLEYLGRHYEQADTSSVGIYGGSYGGFMALYATSVKPNYFDAAAALRAVTNWENYYHTNPWYTMPRLGKPEEDSTHYAQSSPITYVDQLEQPVLILHGLIDNNVGFQDAAQYVHELVQAGDKEFDMMMYPSERHSFSDPDAWYDEYSRIYDFFEEELK